LKHSVDAFGLCIIDLNYAFRFISILFGLSCMLSLRGIESGILDGTY